MLLCWTDRPNFKQRYLEHIRYIRNTGQQSAYAAHVLNKAHEYGSINDNMIFVKQVNKGPYMNSFEQFYIHLYARHINLVPE
jgi:hypothetical protein